MRRRKRKRIRIRIPRVLFCLFVVVIISVSSCTKMQEYHNESLQAKGAQIVGKGKVPQMDIGELCRLVKNWDNYPDELLEMMVKYPETLPFVLGWPGPEKKTAISLSNEYKKGKIPLLIQWDSRWGYEPYGDSMIGISGCGPTCLSMVVVGLTGNTGWNPAKMAAYSKRNGYLVKGVGTDWRLFSTGAEWFGLNVRRLGLTENAVVGELLAGNPIICSMKPGDFTYTGHFIVLTGMDDEGKIRVNDPNSRRNSERTWDLERLMEQIKSAWAYSRE